MGLATISEQQVSSSRRRRRGVSLTSGEAAIRDMLARWLRSAVYEFGERDVVLLDGDASEWACVFRLGICLARHVDSEWQLDSEYNRQGISGDPKRLSVPTQTGGDRVVVARPDIAIHHRGRPNLADNLLFLEVKKEWKGNGNERDLRKARAAVSGSVGRAGGQGFQYQFAAVLGLCVGGTNRKCFTPTWRLFSSSGWSMEQGE